VARNAHVIVSHGHPFARAQARRSADLTNAEKWRAGAPAFPARNKPGGDDTTAARKPRDTCASTALSVGSSSEGLPNIARHVSDTSLNPRHCSQTAFYEDPINIPLTLDCHVVNTHFEPLILELSGIL
jgi:hypothetical protein